MRKTLFFKEKELVKVLPFYLFTLLPLTTACSDSNDLTELGLLETEEQAFGKATGNFTAEEWFPGGELGTTEKASYSAPTPAVEQIAGMESDFMTGNAYYGRTGS